MPSRIAVSLKSTQIRRGVPKAPSNIDLRSVSGFCFAKRNITIDIRTTDASIATALTAIARPRLMLLRLVI